MKRAEIEKRRKLISEYIQANGSLSTDDACRMFHVSDETIRKDFLFLEKLKIVDKYYEYDTVLISIDLFLLKIGAFRHLFFNSIIIKLDLPYL